MFFSAMKFHKNRRVRNFLVTPEKGGKKKKGGKSNMKQIHEHYMHVQGRESGRRKRARESERERERAREWESERERETAVMIDASLPPLCSSERLQQKRGIKALLLSSPVALHLSVSPNATQTRRKLLPLPAINKLRRKDPQHKKKKRGVFALQLGNWADDTAVERERGGRRKKKRRGGGNMLFARVALDTNQFEKD